MTARRGVVGNTVTLISHFYKSGVLFTPSSVNNVLIYDAKVGGNLQTTLAPTNTSTGVYEVTWSIPSTQTLGLYYDEWTWVAASGLSPNIQRGTFEVAGSTILKLSTEASLESRLLLIETSINTLQVAITNLATKKQLNSLVLLIQRLEDEVNQELALLKARVSALENA